MLLLPSPSKSSTTLPRHSAPRGDIVIERVPFGPVTRQTTLSGGDSSSTTADATSGLAPAPITIGQCVVPGSRTVTVGLRAIVASSSRAADVPVAENVTRSVVTGPSIGQVRSISGDRPGVDVRVSDVRAQVSDLGLLGPVEPSSKGDGPASVGRLRFRTQDVVGRVEPADAGRYCYASD